MVIRFADGGSLEIEKLTVDGCKEGKEVRGVGEFGIDAFFENAEEFGKGTLEGLARALGACHAKELDHDRTKGSGETCGGVFKQTETGEEGMHVCECRGETRRR